MRLSALAGALIGITVLAGCSGSAEPVTPPPVITPDAVALPPAQGDAVCPPNVELATAVGGPLEPPVIAGSMSSVPASITCAYRLTGQRDVVAWSIQVTRYLSADEANRGFAALRRAELTVETALPAGPPLGDEVVAGHALREVLIVRHGPFVVKVECPVSQQLAVPRLAKVDGLVKARL